MTKWRLVKVNGDRDGHFITIQFDDWHVLDWRRDWRELYADLSISETWSALSQTGDRFGAWRFGALPEWAVQG